ncbi:hypothetical protein OE987_001470 [Vibrio cholerae]|uniref:hypothetical protein n=1 Tax=Vibrio metoecus TaxID=1481663 RepID=UPI000BA99419|nr:hypothetical protein [Vibrio metoecus]EJY0882899.1 hypothetical protein [Vibrio cholerae]PAR53999.1 hypothetical protein CGT93_10095 [Vibrio metoecus]
MKNFVISTLCFFVFSIYISSQNEIEFWNRILPFTALCVILLLIYMALKKPEIKKEEPKQKENSKSNKINNNERAIADGLLSMEIENRLLKAQLLIENNTSVRFLSLTEKLRNNAINLAISFHNNGLQNKINEVDCAIIMLSSMYEDYKSVGHHIAAENILNEINSFSSTFRNDSTVIDLVKKNSQR